MKFEVELGTFISVFRTEKYVVEANSQDEAIEKAKDKFFDVCSLDGEPGTITVDGVEPLE